MINKIPRERKLTPGQKIIINFHNFTKGYKGSIRLLLITNKLIIIIWDYYLNNKTTKLIILILQHFFTKINA